MHANNPRDGRALQSARAPPKEGFTEQQGGFPGAWRRFAPGNCRQPNVSSAISQATPERYPQHGRRDWARQGGHHRAAHRCMGCSAPGPALLSLESLVGLESTSAAQAPQHLQHAHWHSSSAVPCHEPHEHQGTLHSSTFVLTVSYPSLFLGPHTPLTPARGSAGQTTASTAVISQTRTVQETNRSQLRRVFLVKEGKGLQRFIYALLLASLGLN